MMKEEDKTNKSDIAKKEEQILDFWEKSEIFRKSEEQSEGRPYFSFYDGPPFLSGKPHHGHILTTAIKDTIVRYKTMKGFNVPRRVGWDCHGLPVENIIEKQLGILQKQEIEKIGIDKFNEKAHKYVFSCLDIFQNTLKRAGRWADYSKAYMTLDNSYIESVWWVLKKIWERGLVYQDYRVSPYCPRCGTPLSNFEVNQGYKDVSDPSVYVKFKVKGEENTFLLAWTTTPWTLTANAALAVNPEITYVKIKSHPAKSGTNLKSGNEEFLILAKDRVDIIEREYEMVEEVKGKDLLGIEYEPLFDFLKSDKKAHFVVAADYVSVEDGTGIVHIAPAFGVDDMRVGKENDLPVILTVDENGNFIKDVEPWAGKFVKNADKEIIENLDKRGLLFKQEKVTHAYPFCWRCDSPLLYYPLETWYVAVEKVRDELIKNNQKINWIPEHIKEGRFGRWLEGARDWVFTRNRFWGAPVPIWKCEKCGEIKVVGSMEELGAENIPKDKNGRVNLHRPYIDEIKFSCEKCGGKMKRVEEVFDCWFESGAMPYAQYHYPFENKKFVEETFPADFIAEGIDQTRGWFYTLHVLATILTLEDIGLGEGNPAFKNVVVNGFIMDEKGRKLSKKLKNYTEPELIIDMYGADALRFYLLSSTAIGEDYLFSDKGAQEAMRKIVYSINNSLNFFRIYFDKELMKENLSVFGDMENRPILDKWILMNLNQANFEIQKSMDKYDLAKASRVFVDLFDDLSNWYVRRSRPRFQHPENKDDYIFAMATLYQVLLDACKLLAPFAPFVSESVYQELKQMDLGGVWKESAHLEDYPKAGPADTDLLAAMSFARSFASMALMERSKNNIKVRQPLQKLSIKHMGKEMPYWNEVKGILADEINVKEIALDNTMIQPDDFPVKLDMNITSELKEEGIMREFLRNIQDLRKKAGLQPKQKANLVVQTDENGEKIIEKFKNEIIRLTDLENLEFSKTEEGEKMNIEGLEFFLKISF